MAQITSGWDVVAYQQRTTKDTKDGTGSPSTVYLFAIEVQKTNTNTTTGDVTFNYRTVVYTTWSSVPYYTWNCTHKMWIDGAIAHDVDGSVTKTGPQVASDWIDIPDTTFAATGKTYKLAAVYFSGTRTINYGFNVTRAMAFSWNIPFSFTNYQWYLPAYNTTSIEGTYTFDAVTPAPRTPTLSEVSISNITSRGASASFSVTHNGYANITSQGVQFSNTNFGTVVASFTGTSGSVSTLSRNTTYYARAHASNGSYTGYSVVKSFKTGVDYPTLALSCTGTTATEATFNVSVTDDGGTGYTSGGRIDVFINYPDIVATSNFTNKKVSGLSRYTTYNAMAQVSNGTYIGYSDTISFTTLPQTPVLSAINVTGTTSTSITCNASVTDNGGKTVPDYDRYIDAFTSSNCADNTKVGTISGALSGTISSLSRYTTYYLRANASNGTYRGYSAVKSQTTLAETPVLSNITVSSITSTSATLSSSVSNNGGRAIASSAIDISTTNFGTVYKTISGLSGNVTGLSRNTTYYAKARANNSSYTGYSAVKSFTTGVDNPTLSAITVSNKSDTSASLSFSVTDNGGKAITSSKIEVSETNFGTVVKSISSTSGSVTGLTPNKTYYARGYASNGTTSAYSAVKSFTTSYNMPSAPGVPTLSTDTANPGIDSVYTATWTAATQGSTPIAGYRVRIFVNGVEKLMQDTDTTATTFSFNGIDYDLMPGDLVRIGIYSYSRDHTGAQMFNGSGTAEAQVFSNTLTVVSAKFLNVSVGDEAFSQKNIFISVGDSAFKEIEEGRISVL